MKDAAYIQYGAGWCAPTTWRNFDASPTLRFERLPIIGKLYTRNASPFPKNVEYGDIVRGLPVEDGSARGVFCSHVLEHLPRGSIPLALANTLRLLRSGGRFRLVVPNLEWRARLYLEKLETNEGRPSDWLFQKLHMGQTAATSPKSVLLSWLGNSAHLWMYDVVTLKSLLIEAGFSDVREARFGDCEDTTFSDVENLARFIDDGHPELALEAKRL